MAKQKPNIQPICECGHDRWSHNEQGPYPMDFGNGKSIKGYKLFCVRCRKECGVSTRVLH